MKSLCLILFLALSATPACSHFTASGRGARVYAKHLKKLRVDRERRLVRMRHELAPKLPGPETMVPSEPRETIQMSEDPQAVPGDPAN